MFATNSQKDATEKYLGKDFYYSLLNYWNFVPKLRELQPGKYDPKISIS